VGVPAFDRAGAGCARTWLQRPNATALEILEPLTISDPRLPAQAEELGAMHDSLIAHAREGVLSMGDAAASKACASCVLASSS
jgi:hypothetical protein